MSCLADDQRHCFGRDGHSSGWRDRFDATWTHAGIARCGHDNRERKTAPIRKVHQVSPSWFRSAARLACCACAQRSLVAVRPWISPGLLLSRSHFGVETTADLVVCVCLPTGTARSNDIVWTEVHRCHSALRIVSVRRTAVQRVASNPLPRVHKPRRFCACKETRRGNRRRIVRHTFSHALITHCRGARTIPESLTIRCETNSSVPVFSDILSRSFSRRLFAATMTHVRASQHCRKSNARSNSDSPRSTSLRFAPKRRTGSGARMMVVGFVAYYNHQSPQSTIDSIRAQTFSRTAPTRFGSTPT